MHATYGRVLVAGVESVWFQVGFGDSGRVFVDGLANAGTLKAEIERKNNLNQGRELQI